MMHINRQLPNLPSIAIIRDSATFRTYMGNFIDPAVIPQFVEDTQTCSLHSVTHENGNVRYVIAIDDRDVTSIEVAGMLVPPAMMLVEKLFPDIVRTEYRKKVQNIAVRLFEAYAADKFGSVA